MLVTKLKSGGQNFSGDPGVKNLPANAGGHRFDPCSGEIPQASGQRSQRAPAMSPHSRTHAWKPGNPLQQAAKELQLEAAHEQQ